MNNVNVKTDKDLFKAAVLEEKSQHCTAEQQINFCVKVGRNTLANPDLPANLIAQLLIAKKLPDEPFNFEER